MDAREKGFTGFSTSPREEHRGTRAGHVLEGGKPFNLRSQLKGCTHKVLRAVGVAAPPAVREA